jgi:hypothetical protein
MKTALSKSDLIARNAVLSREVDVLSLALSDLSNGAVKWFGNSIYFSLGISRPRSACGGIVLIKGQGLCTAFYWDMWHGEALAQISACITGEDSEHNRDLLRRRSAIESAAAYVSEQLKAA